MKLSAKITLISVALTVIAVLICCLLIITFAKQNTMDNIVNTGVTDYGRLLTQYQSDFSDSYQNANENTMRSYLIYKFKGCYGSKEYTLQNGEDILVNNTGINAQILLNKSTKSVLTEEGISSSYTLAEANNKTCLIVGKVWVQGEKEYFLSLVRDVSDTMDGISKLTEKCIIVCVIILVVAALIISYLIFYALKPLKKLSENAEMIASGAYDSRITVSGKNEIAELAGSFNNMARAVEQHLYKVETTSEERRMLLSALSHEMKTPVTAIIGYAHALINSKLTDEQKQEAIYFIDKESKRLERLSSKLAQLISMDGNNLLLSEVSCNTLISELKSILSPIAGSNGIILSLESSGQTLVVEQDMIICLVTNLFDNARKAEAKHINIFLDDTALRISDDGRGIPANQIKKITKPFYTLDQSRTGESFGLGLALAHRIAELHHAKLMIESKENEGTTVSLMLK